jgi:protein-S-isoprenylcysteine O-methyltransferase Ste14
MPVWLRAAIFILIVPGTVAGWLPWSLAGSLAEPWRVGQGWWRVGALLTITGWAVLLWCARDFAARGRGTPAPYDAPRQLVTSGLYRYVRNPMYVGVFTAVVGQALWYRSPAVGRYAVLVAVCFHAVVVLYEEPRLRELFGKSYIDYCARVRRWMPGRGVRD